MHVTSQFDQAAFRARNDDGSETAATWKAAVDTDWDQAPDETFRLRFLIQETAGGGSSNRQYDLQYNRNSLGWNFVTATSSVVRVSTSSNVANADDTTQQLGSGTFVTPNGAVEEDNGVAGETDLMDFVGNDEVEVEYVIEVRGVDVADTDTIQLRVLEYTNTLPAYSSTPTLTVDLATSTALSGSVAAELTTAGVATRDVGLAGSVAAELSTVADATRVCELSGSVSAELTTNGVASLAATELSGSVSAELTTAGTATRSHSLSGSVAAELSTVAVTARTVGLSGSAAAELTTVGTAARTHPLAGTVTAELSTVGAATVESGPAIDFESQTFTAVSSSTSWGLTGPSTVNVGDLLLAFLVADDTQAALTGSATGSPTPPTGWAEVQGGVARSAGGDVSGHLFWKVAESGDTTALPQTYTFDGWTASAAGLGHIIRLSGNADATPIDASSITVTASGQASIPLAGVTTSLDNCMVLALTGADESALMEPYWADPMVAGWTQEYGSTSTPHTEGVSSTYSGIAHTNQASLGGTGTVTASIDTENDAIVGFLVAIAPAGTPQLSGTATAELTTSGVATIDGAHDLAGTATAELTTVAAATTSSGSASAATLSVLAAL